VYVSESVGQMVETNRIMLVMHVPSAVCPLWDIHTSGVTVVSSLSGTGGTFVDSVPNSEGSGVGVGRPFCSGGRVGIPTEWCVLACFSAPVGE
jgi:hypothetical protein